MSMPPKSPHQEPEIPAPLLAFAATMVYAELDDWKTGIYVKLPFRADTFASIYQTFVSNLRDLREAQCSRYHRLTATILESAVKNPWRARSSNPRTTESRFLQRALALPDIEDDG
ncbi:hypothetical protein FA13DRAFT_1795965 [Coprinellus micaceus]|uniref:DUF6532 domain-containing protein n=1 Tax=Coprinellus micaceus TaxID=71717 RepID=A0A4Y7SWN5_COPMI|nr:hypothetical protein FA13DRAFT_1795965 [Coprinellus micaceus]